MAPEEEVKQKKVSKEEFDIISNRLAVALAKRESLIKSWTASSSRKPAATKTQEQSDAEDALLFRNQPDYLGVGAPIPAHYFTSDASQDNKSLRAKFFPASGLRASKARGEDEKAASAKRAKRDEDSDEEQGRSALGRAKKLKSKPRIKSVLKEDPVEESEAIQEITELEVANVKKAMHEGEDTKEEDSPKTIEPKVTKSEPAVPVIHEDPTAGNASSLLTSNEDTPMSDGPPASEPDTNTTPNHTMDPQEKKRMKKREKKKRMRAKQKIAQSTAE